MTIRRAMVALVAAGSVAAPAARAEEQPPASPEEEYDQHFIGFDDFGVLDGETGTFHKITEMYQGKYKKPIGGADFYRMVGREDLAQEYLKREQSRNALMIAGGVIALGSVVTSVIIAANGFSSSPCDVTSSAFAQCMADQDSQARTAVFTSAAVGISGLLIGGGFCLAGAGINPNPIDASQMRELADQHNQKLKQQLGVSLLPLASPDKAGLALNVRF